MTQLLHWALEHSDPEKVKELMQKYQDDNLTMKDVYGQELLDELFRDEASDMLRLVAIVADFRNASLESEVLDDALERLQEYIDQIDNAGNLHKMGGLQPLLDLSLGADRPIETRTLALWTLGVATQNNPPVQEDLMGLGALELLAQRLTDCGGNGGAKGPEDPQYCAKLLYTLSGLVKNNGVTQAAADKLGVFDWLIIEGLSHSSRAIAKKSLGLLETVLAQNPELPLVQTLSTMQEPLESSLLQGVRGPAELDVELAEKALRLLDRILSLRPFLFPQGFGLRLEDSVADVLQRCHQAFSPDDEVCSGLSELAQRVKAILTASNVPDEEL